MATIELPGDLPYDPFRSSLYTRDELMGGWPGETLDERIEQHVLDHGFRAPPAAEALAQRLHDHSIDVALSELLCADPHQRVVGIMGGATTRRDDPWYRRAAELARLLTRSGFLVATGGGPGTMEAANLGAFLAGREDSALDEALAIIGEVPSYESDPRPYMACAASVRDRFPDGETSLAIPTWFYPGEPVGQFASHVAKYFANSIREDGLLAIAVSGVVFTPGRAGTVQELFQDAAQNAYGIRGKSPMVLFGSSYYDSNPSIYAVLKGLAARFGDYEELVTLTDEPEDALAFLEANGPADAVAALHECAPDDVLSFIRNERNRAR
jgi:predicted Rossmann-fold nucleotide-binding protein